MKWNVYNINVFIHHIQSEHAVETLDIPRDFLSTGHVYSGLSISKYERTKIGSLPKSSMI